jgi:hypothetical protein
MAICNKLGKACQKCSTLKKHSSLAIINELILYRRCIIEVYRFSLKKAFQSITSRQDNKNIERTSR